jgi:hypothetical protein
VGYFRQLPARGDGFLVAQGFGEVVFLSDTS